MAKAYSTGLTRADAECVLAFAKNNMRSSPAGREMYRSHRAVVYHLSRAHGETGLDPQRFYDLVKLIPIALKTIREADEEGA